mmetsp:Transcript_11618/g.5821  ORF Transcript_11618/g.5821 Transcript_11618/m.5821 type:complete len:132 (-) Transcript_11618:499-894(-)
MLKITSGKGGSRGSMSSKGVPKRKHVHGEDTFLTAKKMKKPSPIEFIKLIRKDPELSEDFWYCLRKKNGDAYDFEFVSFDKVDKKVEIEYLTISSRGVTHFINKESTFMTLGEWEREYNLFNKLKKIKFFE